MFYWPSLLFLPILPDFSPIGVSNPEQNGGGQEKDWSVVEKRDALQTGFKPYMPDSALVGKNPIYRMQVVRMHSGLYYRVFFNTVVGYILSPNFICLNLRLSMYARNVSCVYV